MQDAMRAVIHKAPVQGLRVHVGRTALCIGDPAELRLFAGGEVGIYALGWHRIWGIIPRRTLLYLGQLDPSAIEQIIGPLSMGQNLRVRIVGLTPEHLAGENGPEIFVSVWGSLPISKSEAGSVARAQSAAL